MALINDMNKFSFLRLISDKMYNDAVVLLHCGVWPVQARWYRTRLRCWFVVFGIRIATRGRGYRQDLQIRARCYL